MAQTTLAAILLTLALPAAAEQEGKKPLVVTFLDIGQGDSTLIETPGGRVILVDGGEGKTPDAKVLYPFDAGSRVILPVLRAKSISRLDLVVESHPHSDHIGGLVDVLADPAIETKEVWDSGFAGWKYPTYERLRGLVAEKKIPCLCPKEGAIYDWGDGVTAKVVRCAPDAHAPNDASIVLRISYGDVSILLTGDSEDAAEKAMVAARSSDLKSTILKVAHHASKTSTSKEFLAAVAPKVAVISCGDYNGYGHPHPQTMETLATAKCDVHRTDLESHVEVRIDGKGYEIRTAAKGQVALPQAKFEPPAVAASALKEHVDEHVAVTGTVTQVSKFGKGDNYLLTIDGTAKVVAYGNQTKEIGKLGFDVAGLKGKKVTVAGLVNDGKYGLQLLLRSPRSFRVGR